MSVHLSRDQDGFTIEWIGRDRRLLVGLDWNEPLWWSYLELGKEPVEGKRFRRRFVKAVLRMTARGAP